MNYRFKKNLVLIDFLSIKIDFPAILYLSGLKGYNYLIRDSITIQIKQQ
jgi:hypothetical protein